MSTPTILLIALILGTFLVLSIQDIFEYRRRSRAIMLDLPDRERVGL